jgi:glycosyltransferase involved in cell wall biosynthesis
MSTRTLRPGTGRPRSIRAVRVLLDVSAVPERPVGAGRYTVALASGLAARTDVELRLLSRRNDTSRWAQFAPAAEVVGSAPVRRPARLVWEQARGASVATRLNADVWHGPHYTMPLRAGVPSIVTIHDLTFFDHPEWHQRSKVVFFRRMIRAAAQRATVLVCVSEYTADRLRSLLDPRGEVIVAHHGVDHDRFVAKGDDRVDLAALARHGIQPPYIAFASTIEPRKNVPTLVRAFSRVAASRPDLRLVLAGADGWGARAARDAIAASGVATRVIRPGYLAAEDVPALFRQAAVVAYPSFEEGFGLPALEGLACGAPVVTTTGSALAEVVEDAALKVPPGDADALADAIGSILDYPAIEARLRAAGPARAAQFTWSRCVEQHVDAYRRATIAGVLT